MPTTQGKARKLLKQNKAKVYKRYPFTIQLNYATGEAKQNITLGIDTGYNNIGFSAITEKEEIYSGTLELDSKTTKRLTGKRMYRRTRRNRLRYRKPRFNNRVKTKHKGWLPPSIKRRYETHINLIRKIKNILPISRLILEIAKFDIQKIENPGIEGSGYQQGNMYGYQNLRSYLMSREKGKCQLCGKEFSKTDPAHIHHVISRNDGGTNKPKNLALLHKSCHQRLHKKNLNHKLKKNKEYKGSTFMSIIHKKFYKDLPSLEVTYGNITFVNRNSLGLEKSHSNDAFVIAGGNIQKRINPIVIKQKHRNNRSLGKQRKGFAPSSRKKRYKIQPMDLVKIAGKWLRTNGVHCKGKRLMVNKKSININKVESIYSFGSFIFN